MKKRDNSNIDILKILCMFLIIAHHYVYDSLMLNVIDTSNWFYNFLYLGGKFGTALFVIITGYFISNKEFELKRILKFAIKTDLYCWVLLFIFIFVLKYKVNTIEIIKSIFPITMNRYWFATSYVILYLFSPYINIVVNKISKLMYIKLLILMTVLIMFLPIFNLNYIFNNTTCLIYYYLIGAYIRKFNVKLFSKNWVNLLMFITLYLIIFISSLVILKLSFSHHVLIGKEFFFTRLNSVLVLTSSIFCFVYFINLRVRPRKILNFISSATFGIYLLHDNYFIKNYVFPKIFEYIQISNFKYLYSILFIVLVLLLCSFIDYVISFIINVSFNVFQKRKAYLKTLKL